ncbi:MAG: hypothetical protein ABFD13_05295 [Candidatus Cryosericum sp.]|nr:hypothetical protein [bacterium]
MKRKISCGPQPKLIAKDKDMFSRSNYECHILLQNRKGEPVPISQNNDPDFPVWKIEYAYSCMVFGSYDEAMAYCKGRFFDVRTVPAPLACRAGKA